MLSNKVKRITKLHVDEHGSVRTEVVADRQRKKSSKQLQPLERVVRRMAKAQNTFSSSYLDRHQRSKKKRYGWLRDFGVNVLRATSKASKHLRFI